MLFFIIFLFFASTNCQFACFSVQHCSVSEHTTKFAVSWRPCAEVFSGGYAVQIMERKPHPKTIKLLTATTRVFPMSGLLRDIGREQIKQTDNGEITFIFVPLNVSLL